MVHLHIFSDMEEVEVRDGIAVRSYRNTLSSEGERGHLWRYWELSPIGPCTLSVGQEEGEEVLTPPPGIGNALGRHLRLTPATYDCHAMVEAIFWRELNPQFDGFGSPFRAFPSSGVIPPFSPMCLLDKHGVFVHSFLEIRTGITLSKIGSLGLCATTIEELMDLYPTSVEVAVLKPVPR